MEGLSIPDESGQRGLVARKLLGDEFELLLPEEWQDKVTDHRDIQKVDLERLISADIIIVDFYRMGLIRDNEPILGRGTNQEVGFTKCWNKLNTSKFKKPIVQVVRQTKNFHPFDKEDFGVINFHSLEEACEYIKENY